MKREVPVLLWISWIINQEKLKPLNTTTFFIYLCGVFLCAGCFPDKIGDSLVLEGNTEERYGQCFEKNSVWVHVAYHRANVCEGWVHRAAWEGLVNVASVWTGCIPLGNVRSLKAVVFSASYDSLWPNWRPDISGVRHTQPLLRDVFLR